MSGDLEQRVARAMAENNVLEKHDWEKLAQHQKNWWLSDAKFAIRVVVEECARLAEEPLSIDFGRQSLLKINKRHDKISSDIRGLLGDGE